MTSLLMSSPPISISHRLFRCRYSNSRDVVASSSSFSRLAYRAHPNSAVALRRLRSKISSNQREGETSANVNQHRNTRAMGNDVITNVISANQHFASTFSMSIFKFQRRSCKLFFLFPPRLQGASKLGALLNISS